MIDAPDLLSDAIIMAVNDTEEVERTPGIKIDMSFFHAASYGSEEGRLDCSVCFAGAIMHSSLNFPMDEDYHAEYFGMKWGTVFRQLNDIRLYDIADAIHGECELGDREDIEGEVLAGIGGESYADDPGQFKRNMREIATRLAAKGY